MILAIIAAETIGILTGSYGLVVFVVVMVYGWRHSERTDIAS